MSLFSTNMAISETKSQGSDIMASDNDFVSLKSEKNL